MEIKTVSQFPRNTVERLLASIPFYKMVKEQSLWQFELLLQHSRIVRFSPGEVVLAHGERDSWLYFLLKGQLIVSVAKDSEPPSVVNYITPGEVFGDLALLVGERRSATVVADANSREVLAFGTDFSIFGEVEDFRLITLATKLAFYRNTVHNLRWKLEVYRSRHPGSTLAHDHHRVALYTGPRDTRDELKSLHSQAVQLTKLLMQWNRAFGQLSLAETGAPDPQVVGAMMAEQPSRTRSVTGTVQSE